MSNICFSLKIGKGQFTMYTPVRVSIFRFMKFSIDKAHLNVIAILRTLRVTFCRSSKAKSSSKQRSCRCVTWAASGDVRKTGFCLCKLPTCNYIIAVNNDGFIRCGKMFCSHFRCTLGLIPLPNEKMPLKMYGNSLPSHLRCIIYSSDKGVMVKPHGHDDSRDFLSVAVSIKPSKDFVGFKVLKHSFLLEYSRLFMYSNKI